MVFARLLSGDMQKPETENEPEEKQEKFPEKENMRFFGQWKNLLDYDGTRQEETDYEDR